MDSFEKIKNYFKKKGGDKGKKIFSSKELLIVAILTGIILIIASSSMFSNNKDNTMPQIQDQSKSNAAIQTSISPSDNGLDIKQIENIIAKIDGAGKVSVMITYDNGVEKVPATDNNSSNIDTVEKDAQGGNREVTDTKQDSKVVYEDGDSSTKKVFIAKEIQPKIKGVLIVSSGADNAEVKSSIARSAQILFNLPIHKIQVVKGNR